MKFAEIFAVVISSISMFIAAGGFYVNAKNMSRLLKQDTRNDGATFAVMQAEISYIKAKLDDITISLKNYDGIVVRVSERLASGEAMFRADNKRVDELYKIIGEMQKKS